MTREFTSLRLSLLHIKNDLMLSMMKVSIMSKFSSGSITNLA